MKRRTSLAVKKNLPNQTDKWFFAKGTDNDFLALHFFASMKGREPPACRQSALHVLQLRSDSQNAACDASDGSRNYAARLDARRDGGFVGGMLNRNSPTPNHWITLLAFL